MILAEAPTLSMMNVEKLGKRLQKRVSKLTYSMSMTTYLNSFHELFSSHQVNSLKTPKFKKETYSAMECPRIAWSIRHTLIEAYTLERFSTVWSKLHACVTRMRECSSLSSAERRLRTRRSLKLHVGYPLVTLPSRFFISTKDRSEMLTVVADGYGHGAAYQHRPRQHAARAQEVGRRAQLVLHR